MFGFYQAPADRRTGTRRRRKNRRVRLLVLLLVVIAVLLVVLRQCGSLPFFVKEDAGLTYVGDIPVYEDFLPEDAVARPGGNRAIKWVVIHETDNVNAGADAEAHNRFIHENGMTEPLSWHYTVDDHEIYHHLPDNEPAYHAGDQMEENGGNKNGIGVEMCVNEDGDYETTLKNAQKLAATLLVSYDLSMDALRKHEDFSGKNCPSQLLNAGRWEEFKAGVEEEYNRLRAQE